MPPAKQHFRLGFDLIKEQVILRTCLRDPKTRAKHAYLTEKLDAGHNVFSVPAVVIAALLGYAYETRQNRADFKADILQKHVDYTNHWVRKSKSSVRQSVLHQSYGDDLEFPIPGEASKSYCVRGSSEARTQYVFLTPIYARFLLSRHDDRLHTFFHKVHDEVRKMIRGEDSVFAVQSDRWNGFGVENK